MDNLTGFHVNIESVIDIWEYMLHSFPEFAKYKVPYSKIDVYIISNKTMKKFENTQNTVKGLALGRTYQMMNQSTNEIRHIVLINKVLNNNNRELLNTLFHELLHVIEFENKINNSKLTTLFETLVGSAAISEEKVNLNLANRIFNGKEE